MLSDIIQRPSAGLPVPIEHDALSRHQTSNAEHDGGVRFLWSNRRAAEAEPYRSHS